MIVEPLVQGAGGMIVYSIENLKRFHQLCVAHDVLFIADEVFTGFGRTGRMFAHEHVADKWKQSARFLLISHAVGPMRRYATISYPFRCSRFCHLLASSSPTICSF